MGRVAEFCKGISLWAFFLLLLGTKRQRIGTGVIISREGYVLTHGHHEQLPGTPIAMIFGDGRKASGRLLGVHRHDGGFDLSLVKLSGSSGS